jgi:hypothetical protein
MSTVKLEDIRSRPIKTTDSDLRIDMSDDKLPVGGHTFQLEVADDSGNVSAPATVMVIIADTQAPTAVVTVNDAEGRPAENNRIAFGADFVLNGKKSIDIGGGRIVSYNWALVD